MLSTNFHADMKVGEIVARFPHASNVFKASQIDFCCGGGVTLAQAARQKALDVHQLLSQLEEAYATFAHTETTDWMSASSSAIIREVIHKHHAYLSQELPLLSEFLTKVLRVHGQEHPELASLHRMFHLLKMELEQHLIKEETAIFPLIEAYEANPSNALLDQIQTNIRELEQEHDEAGQLLKQMRAVTKDYSLPTGACRTYTVTYQKLEHLENDMFTHVHLENNILFPRYTLA